MDSREEKWGEKGWERKDGDHTQKGWGFLVPKLPGDAWLDGLTQLFLKPHLCGFLGVGPTLVLRHSWLGASSGPGAVCSCGHAVLCSHQQTHLARS